VSQKHLFLYGKIGTGKSWFIRSFLHETQ
jgi:predicted ATPase